MNSSETAVTNGEGGGVSMALAFPALPDKREMDAPLVPAPLPQWVHESRLKFDTDNDRDEIPEDESLEGLGQSIISHGVMQNLQAGQDGTVYAGNRRLMATRKVVLVKLQKELDGITGEDDFAIARRKLLAAAIEKAAFLPVRVLDEEEASHAAERALIENLQREDLTAIQEARGFGKLLAMKDEEGNAVHTPESLEASTGKSAIRIRQRVKIVNAPPFLLKALEAGDVGTVQCEMIARIPNAKDREEAARRVLEPKTMERPLNKRETAELIRTEYMIYLQHAPFDQADGALVPDAGPCKTCKYLSGNDPTLEGEFRQWETASAGFAPNVCTNPTCYRAKTEAAWKVLQGTAEADGYGVLSNAAAEAEFSGTNGALSHMSKYIDLDGKPTPKHTGHYSERGVKKWRVVLKPLLDGKRLQVVKARNPVTGKIHDLVKWEAVLAVQKAGAAAAAKGEKPESTTDLFGHTDFGGLDAQRAEEAERQRKAEERAAKRLEQKVALKAVDMLADLMAPDDKGVYLQRDALLLTFEVILNGNADGCAFMAQFLEIPKVSGQSARDYLPAIVDAVRRQVVNDPRPNAERDLEGFLALAALAPGVKYHGVTSPDFVRMARIYGLDLKKVEKDVKAAAESGGETMATPEPVKKKAPPKKKAAAKKKAAPAKKVPVSPLTTAAAKAREATAKKKAPAKKATAAKKKEGKPAPKKKTAREAAAAARKKSEAFFEVSGAKFGAEK